MANKKKPSMKNPASSKKKIETNNETETQNQEQNNTQTQENAETITDSERENLQSEMENTGDENTNNESTEENKPEDNWQDVNSPLTTDVEDTNKQKIEAEEIPDRVDTPDTEGNRKFDGEIPTDDNLDDEEEEEESGSGSQPTGDTSNTGSSVGDDANSEKQDTFSKVGSESDKSKDEKSKEKKESKYLATTIVDAYIETKAQLKNIFKEDQNTLEVKKVQGTYSEEILRQEIPTQDGFKSVHDVIVEINTQLDDYMLSVGEIKKMKQSEIYEWRKEMIDTLTELLHENDVKLSPEWRLIIGFGKDMLNTAAAIYTVKQSTKQIYQLGHEFLKHYKQQQEQAQQQTATYTEEKGSEDQYKSEESEPEVEDTEDEKENEAEVKK